MIKKTIVCLANSRKNSGRCIAGKEALPDGNWRWIRPISCRPGAEVSEEERRYEDGTSPQVLDVVSIQMTAAAPMLYQTENSTTNPASYWQNRGRVGWSDVMAMLDQPDSLWLNGESSYAGANDRIRLDAASLLRNSLVMIQPMNLEVTDPVVEESFLAKADGNISYWTRC